VTAGRRYLLGLAAAAAAGAGLTALTPAPIRGQVAWGALVALVLQAPLGWWAIRSIGTEHFLVTWGLGILVRLTVVAIAGVAVVPSLGWSPGPTLGALVTMLVALLLVEGFTAWRAYSRDDER
jgi:hypothetical protein